MVIACPECHSHVSAREPVMSEFDDPKNGALVLVKCTRCDCLFDVRVAILKSGREIPRGVKLA